MEIFTSFIFWIVVVIIIVLLGIIGYLAEGTILANKKREEEAKNKAKAAESDENTWLKEAPTEAEQKQETVYTTADNSWYDMPDISNTQTLQDNDTAQANNLNQNVENTMMPEVTPVEENENNASNDNLNIPEVTQSPVQVLDNDAGNNEKEEKAETLDVWK